MRARTALHVVFRLAAAALIVSAGVGRHAAQYALVTDPLWRLVLGLAGAAVVLLDWFVFRNSALPPITRRPWQNAADDAPITLGLTDDEEARS